MVIAGIDRGIFFTSLRQGPVLLGGLRQGQVDGLEALLDEWDASWAEGDRRWLAYELATEVRETGSTMVPLREWGRGQGRPYGRPAGPFGQIYYGRGRVQATWLVNYEKAQAELGLPFVQQPDLMLDLKVSARVALRSMAEGWWTGKKFADYFPAGGPAQPIGARRIINGLDHAGQIASYWPHFCEALEVEAK